MSSLDDLLHAAHNAAHAAAEVHRRSHRLGTGAWTEKGHSDWVSEVDHEAEEAAVAEVRAAFPDHAIAAEERDWGGPSPDRAEVTWYIDPLDGTTNYLHGYPCHSASVAAVDSQGPAAAAVVNSGRWETFQAVQFRAILPQTSGIRRTGSAAIDLCDLACGRLDGFWELYLAPWDVAAGVLILREAGGIITDLEGSAEVIKHGAFIAGNPDIYPALRRLLQP